MQIEQETLYRDNTTFKEPIMKAHVVDKKSTKKKPDNKKFSKAKKSTKFMRTNSNPMSNECYHFHKIGHYAHDCRILKTEKKKEKINDNRKMTLWQWSHKHL